MSLSTYQLKYRKPVSRRHLALLRRRRRRSYAPTSITANHEKTNSRVPFLLYMIIVIETNFDYHLQPLVRKRLASFIKDTNDFVNKLRTMGNLPANSSLVTLDVSSLYNNIPHNEGINACQNFYVLPFIIPFLLAHTVISLA